ncbi:MAG: BMC domain-containing protein [Bifidobacteriaceae bacterium]|jgi:microcompartment protein CcmL/EutN|nr:BMC domain-containing protein [Bifidobacteriaceae bacterium]
MKVTSIGLIELGSIARGVEVTDVMLKAGQVELSFSKPVCPGKYTVMVYGDVGAVKASVAAGLDAGGTAVVNHLIIPRLHSSVLPAINAAVSVGPVNAVGVVEYFDIASAIVGADAAVKTGRAELIQVRLGMGIGGKSFFVLTGDVADVKAAVDAGLYDAKQRGAVVASCVIPAPDPRLFEAML